MALAPLVLLVEDDPWLAESMEQALDSEGYRCLWVRDGAQALEVCQGLRPQIPSLYVGEAMTPVMSGLEFLQIYRGETFPSLIIGSSDTLLQEALDLGASQILQKPFRVEAFLEKVSELIGRAKAPEPELKRREFFKPRFQEVPAWSGALRQDWLDSICTFMNVECARVQIPLEGEFWCASSGGKLSHSFSHRRSSMKASLSSIALESGEPLWIPDLQSTPFFSATRWVGDFKECGIRSFCSLPLSLAGGVPIGTLDLLSKKPHFFSHLRTEVLKVLGSALLKDAMTTGSSRFEERSGLSVEEFSLLLRLLISESAALGEALSVIRLDDLVGETGQWWETTLREKGWGGALWASLGDSGGISGNCLIWWGMDSLTLQERLASLDRLVSASVFDATRFLGAPQKLLEQLYRQGAVAPQDQRQLRVA